jgi:hypothetical protein
MEQCGMTLTEKELREMADQIDKDGTGTFDFAEFSELVKLLLIRLRQAHVSVSPDNAYIVSIITHITRFSCRQDAPDSLFFLKKNEGETI